MKARIEYWNPKNETVVTESGFRYLNTNSALQKVEEWFGTEEEIFKKFYKENNSLRYCNGSHYKFEDKNLDTKYRDWYKSLDKNTQFSMYYGNGVVD